MESPYGGLDNTTLRCIDSEQENKYQCGMFSLQTAEVEGINPTCCRVQSTAKMSINFSARVNRHAKIVKRVADYVSLMRIPTSDESRS